MIVTARQADVSFWWLFWVALPSSFATILAGFSSGRFSMRQLRSANVSSILMGATLALACSSSESDEGAASSPVEMNAPAAMNAPEAPGQVPEAQPDGAPAGSRAPEGQPANVGLAPPSMAMPPVAAMPPAPPSEMNQPAADGAPVPSAGCGSSAAVESGRFSIDVAGAQREYILELPDDYDASRPYRLIFAWHWRGGNAAQVADGFYGLQQRAEGSAIFVSAEGLDAGWANTDGRDIAFLDAMLGRLEGDLCIDESRVFSTGWSYGGMMSLAIGCARGDVFRAIAPMSGALYSGCADGDAPVAFLGFHGDDDDVVPIGNGVAARNEFVERNGCQPEAAAVEADGCLRFEGCAAGAPLTWCEFDGGHTPAPGSDEAIWDFFSQF
jgi:polyhydroxybutyrate depolymerase